MEKIVTHFLIGAPKSGTTAMAAYLNDHPLICISNPKETGYFIQETSMVKPVLDYEKTYFTSFNEVHKVAIDCTPLYLANHYSINKILKYNSTAQFIVMIRHPVDLFLSFHSQLLFEGFENQNSPQKAWELQELRSRGKHIPITCREAFLLQYKNICSNGLNLQNLFTYTSPASTHIILFDDFKNNPKLAYQELLAFLDVEDDKRSDFSPVNQRKGISTVGKSLLTIQALGSKLKNKLHLSSGFGVGDILRNFAHNHFRTESSAFSPSKNFLAELQKIFLEDINLIEYYSGKKLDSWKKKYI